MISNSLCPRPASVLLVLLWALSLSPTHYSYANLFPRDGILDSIPPSCAQACQVIATSLDTCDYGTCLCTEDGGQGLENCMNCLYGMSPSQDVYNAAQGTLSEFEDTCSPMLNISLNITPIVSSTIVSSTSTSSTPLSISASASTNTTSTSLTSMSSNSSPTPTSTPTTSPAIKGEYYGKQKCVIVANKDALSHKRSISSASKADIRSTSKRSQIILPALMFITSPFI